MSDQVLIRNRNTSGIVGVAILMTAIAVAATGSIGPNFELACLAAMTFAVGGLLLWKPGESPILLVIFLFQWLQASVAIFRATFRNEPVEALFDISGDFNTSIVLTHIALLCLAIGMKIGAGPVRQHIAMQTRSVLLSQSTFYWFRLYVIFWCVGSAALYGGRLAPGLSQIFLGINDLHWAFFFILAAAHFIRPGKSGIWFYIAFAFELLMGIGGFFSDFKTVFIVSFLGLIAVGVRLTPKWIFLAAAMAGGALYLGVIWTAVKPEYRAFVSGGSVQQVVTVGYAERMQKLGALAADVDQEQFNESLDDFAARLSYIKFFGATLEHVPEAVPHENGALLLDAIVRPFTPRMFFPDKAIIDDSERTRLYTGGDISGRERGTSISLGWVAEIYVDFGRWLMMLAALAIGIFYGSIQQILMRWRASEGLLGMACSSAVLVNAILLESSITKVTGGLIASLIAVWLTMRFVMPILAPAIVRKR